MRSLRVVYFSLIFSFLFHSPVTMANFSKENCSEVKAHTETMLRNMNSLFGTKVKIKYLKVAHDPFEFMPKGNQTREKYVPPPLTLMDANAAESGFIQMPDPCLILDDPYPSKELWSLILAHEHSHKILDLEEDHCSEAHASRLEAQYRGDSSSAMVQHGNMHHTNNDVLALKILQHFNIDSSKALHDMEVYNNKNTGGSAERAIWHRRQNYLKKIIPTDFNRGDDFLPVMYSSHTSRHFFRNALSKHYPHSTMIADVLKGAKDKDEKCHYYSQDSIQEAEKMWNEDPRRLRPSVRTDR